jgi:hypothetical protein
MIVELLKYHSTLLDYTFTYGRMHWQNLNDFECDHQLSFDQRKKHLLLLYVDDNTTFNEHNSANKVTYDFEFILAVKSKITDPDYEFKYETHIKNLKSEVNQLIEDKIAHCADGLTLNSYKTSEVENLLDTNLDGLKVKVSLTIDPNYYQLNIEPV